MYELGDIVELLEQGDMTVEKWEYTDIFNSYGKNKYKIILAMLSAYES